MTNTVTEVIKTQSREFSLIRKDEFVIRSDDYYKDKDPVFCMKRFNIKYSSHEITNLYEETQYPVDSIRYFLFDYFR